MKARAREPKGAYPWCNVRSVTRAEFALWLSLLEAALDQPHPSQNLAEAIRALTADATVLARRDAI